eukprot:jgi/Mesvir1/13439/Mv25625-RA.1
MASIQHTQRCTKAISQVGSRKDPVPPSKGGVGGVGREVPHALNWNSPAAQPFKTVQVIRQTVT